MEEFQLQRSTARANLKPYRIDLVILHHLLLRMAEKSSETATEDNVAPPGAQAPVEHQKEFEIVEWFKNKIKESRVTFVVYYRGFW